jgi:hypothetical protein
MPDMSAIPVARLYADDFGESAFETVTIPMLQKEFAPPAAQCMSLMPSPPNITWSLSFAAPHGFSSSTFSSSPSVAPVLHRDCRSTDSDVDGSAV